MIIMAGGAGDRLQPLTKVRSKPAVPFGGKFRLIDFTLSNCINSGIRQISVLIQYRSTSLQRHIQEGWGISRSGLGDFIYCVPAQQKIGMDWYVVPPTLYVKTLIWCGIRVPTTLLFFPAITSTR